MLKRFFLQKIFWIGIVALTLGVFIFSWAFLGSTVNPQPVGLPAALVVEDAERGEQIRSQLLALEDLPVAWSILDSEQAAVDGMNKDLYYGALIIPDTFSAALQSMSTPDPQPAGITIYINQGKHMTGSQAIRQVLEGVAERLNEQMSQQLLAAVGQSRPAVPLEHVPLLGSPVEVETIILHPVPENTANGNAGNVLTQLAWLGALFTTLVVYQAWRKSGMAGWYTLPIQWLGGALLLLIVAGVLLLTAQGMLGLYVPENIPLYGTLFLIACCFFLFQSAFINWFGFPGMLVPVLVFFFGLPILNLAPEMLPQWSQDWLYSWVPFRFSSEALRRLLFLDDRSIVWDALQPLIWYGLASAGAGWLTAVRKRTDMASNDVRSHANE